MKLRRAAVRPYAKALFSISRERRQVDEVARALETLSNALRAEESLRAVLSRPWIGSPVKRKIATEVAAGLGVSTLAHDFFTLVAARDRAGYLAAIAAEYRDLVDEDRGVVRVGVRTAVPIGQDERAALGRQLGRLLGGKQVVVEETVDQRVLGGFVAEIGDLVVDGSLRGQLARIRERLARGPE